MNRLRKSWYPKADDLQLFDVPLAARDRVRKFLRPFLSSIPVRQGKCYQIAQALTLVANSPKVKYVEGVWNEKTNCSCNYCRAEIPDAHAWNLVDGYRVDLVEELFFNLHGKRGEFKHETLKVFTVTDLKNFEKRYGDWNSQLGNKGGDDATYSLLHAVWDMKGQPGYRTPNSKVLRTIQSQGFSDPVYKAEERFVFRKAIERLQDRLKITSQKNTARREVNQMANRTKSLKSIVPKAIRNDVKSLLKNAKSSNIDISMVIADRNKRSLTVGVAGICGESLRRLTNQAADNYLAMAEAFQAGYQESVTAA